MQTISFSAINPMFLRLEQLRRDKEEEKARKQNLQQVHFSEVNYSFLLLEALRREREEEEAKKAKEQQPSVLPPETLPSVAPTDFYKPSPQTLVQNKEAAV